MYDVAVIGAGITGAFVARELSKYNISVIVIEKNSDVCNGTTGANCSNVYEAFRPEPGSTSEKLVIRGNEIYDEVCKELDVPFKRIGSLLVGLDEEDRKLIEKQYNKAIRTKVPGVRIIDREEIRKLEPNIDSKYKFALYSESCGVLWPFEMVVALMENAMDNGVELILNSEVKAVEKLDKGFKVIMREKTIEAKTIVNCAGIYADRINNMVAENCKFNLIPKKAQFFVLNENVGPIFTHVISKCPKSGERGLNILPTVYGNIMIGPLGEEANDKEDIGTSLERIELLKEKISKISSKIPYDKTIRCFSGLNFREENGKVILGESEEVKGFINIVNINPGLTCAPAIAEEVTDTVKYIFERDYEVVKYKKDFNPKRRKVYRFNQLTESEKQELIKKDPRYGKVICYCEGITEGEIVDVIHRNAGAVTIKGVKNRTKALMGECQGGFCEPKIVEILARELDKDMSDIKYSNDGSYILVKNTDE